MPEPLPQRDDPAPVVRPECHDILVSVALACFDEGRQPKDMDFLTAGVPFHQIQEHGPAALYEARTIFVHGEEGRR